MSKLATVALASLMGIGVATDAFANTEASPPMTDVPTSQQNITMSFTGPVNISRTTVMVYGPRGQVHVGQLKQGTNSGDVVIPLAGDLKPGLYVVHFQAYSEWGTAMSGTSTVEVPGRPSLTTDIGPGVADALGR